MFDIGFLELAIIFVLGIVIIGPERMPDAVRGVLRFWGKVKHTLSETRSEFEKQIGADEIRRELHNERVMKALEKTQAKAQAEFEEISRKADINESLRQPELGKRMADHDANGSVGEDSADRDGPTFEEDDGYNDYHAQQHERQSALEAEKSQTSKPQNFDEEAGEEAGIDSNEPVPPPADPSAHKPKELSAEGSSAKNPAPKKS